MITGQEWVKASEREKIAFLLGVATVVQTEMQLRNAHPPEMVRSVVPAMMDRFANADVTAVVEELDSWYQFNQEQLSRNVMETIWYELVLPSIDPAHLDGHSAQDEFTQSG